MTGLSLTFLGTGTSVGVPMIGCDCDTCRSNDPRDKRLRSSIYLQTPECSWIVDTGPDFREPGPHVVDTTPGSADLPGCAMDYDVFTPRDRPDAPTRPCGR